MSDLDKLSDFVDDRQSEPNQEFNFLPVQHELTTCAGMNDLLPEKLCDLLIEEIKELEKNDEFYLGVTGLDLNNSSETPSDDTLKKVRNSKVCFLPLNHWIVGIVWNYVINANRDVWQYDISGIQSLQLTKYEEGQFYQWHTDFCPIKNNPDYYRKLSIVIQLNSPDEYEGGYLELLDYNNRKVVIPKIKGYAGVFDGRTLHRVTKIKKGTRYSLVAWIVGPQLR